MKFSLRNLGRALVPGMRGRSTFAIWRPAMSEASRTTLEVHMVV